jgi:hypothetical protein
VKISYVITLVMILMLAVSCSSHKKDIDTPGTAEWLMNQFFVNPNPPDLREYMAGEMLRFINDATYGATVPLDVKTTCHQIQQDSLNAIWGITSRYGEDTRNMYCYLVHGAKAWQMVAIVWMPAYDVFMEQIGQLKAMPEETDSIKWEIRSKELGISTDSALGKYFVDSKGSWDKLGSLTSSLSGLQMYRERCSDPSYAGEHDSLYGKVCPLMNELCVRAIYHGSEECPAGTFYEVSSWLRNSVGYLYVPEGAKPPAMSYKRFFYIQKVAENWYLYKAA